LLIWVERIRDGEIPSALGVTLQRVGLAYVVAVLSAVLFGLLMGYFRAMFVLLEPLTEVLRPIPATALVPVAILFLGIGDEMKRAMVIYASFFPILINTYSGVRSVDPVLIDTARTLGLSTGEIVREIILRAASPYIVAGMRISLAIALVVVVVAEMIAGGDGIGYFILQSERSFRVKEMYAGVITLGLLGYLLNVVFLMIERRVMAWHIGFTGQLSAA
jgi:ABC-type nitrate/sulfonate/bicarbonate transport system permease component